MFITSTGEAAIEKVRGCFMKTDDRYLTSSTGLKNFYLVERGPESTCKEYQEKTALVQCFSYHMRGLFAASCTKTKLIRQVTLEFDRTGFDQHSGDMFKEMKYLACSVLSRLYNMCSQNMNFPLRTSVCTFAYIVLANAYAVSNLSCS